MKNFSKKSNATNRELFVTFSKFQLKNKQLKKIKGGSDGGGNGEDGNAIITDDIIGG